MGKGSGGTRASASNSPRGLSTPQSAVGGGSKVSDYNGTPERAALNEVASIVKSIDGASAKFYVKTERKNGQDVRSLGMTITVPETATREASLDFRFDKGNGRLVASNAMRYVESKKGSGDWQDVYGQDGEEYVDSKYLKDAASLKKYLKTWF